MKKWLSFLLLTAFIWLSGCAAHPAAEAAEKSPLPTPQTAAVEKADVRSEPVRVACIGDSITYGFHLDPADTYPAQLQTYLGDGYVVENFGLNGAAVSDYVNTPVFAAARDFEPDIMVIMLGSNDTNAFWWLDAETFADRYELLLDTCDGTGANLILCTCSAAYPISGGYQFGVDPAALTQVCDVIRATAQVRDLPLVDIDAVTSDHPEWYALDGVHPDAAGSAAIAQAVAETLTPLSH